MSGPSICWHAPKRMNREEFLAKLAPFDEDGLRRALWNLCWQGSAALRERIEGELDPAEQDRRRRAAMQLPDPEWVLREVEEFAELARAGACIAGDRRVSPQERTRWRGTFLRLAADAQAALVSEGPGPAEEALALIIDLACEMRTEVISVPKILWRRRGSSCPMPRRCSGNPGWAGTASTSLPSGRLGNWPDGSYVCAGAR